MIHSNEIETRKVVNMKRILKWNWKRLIPIIVCFALVMAIVITILNQGGGDIDLKLSSGGIKVNYMGNLSSLKQSSDLLLLPEAEHFAENFEKYTIVIFSGTVKEVHNIEVDYNGVKDYRAIASIETEEVFRGNLEAGDILTVLLPTQVGVDLKIEDTDILSQMEVGTTGIFMPIKYDKTSYRDQNSKRLYLLDIAEYGFLDGEQWAFLETAEGLIFNRQAYPSIIGATTVDEIKSFIQSQLNFK